MSYRQVIAAFPNGGGAYAVSKAHLGRDASPVAAASLIVDYVLNAAVGVSAGVAALTAAHHSLYGAIPRCCARCWPRPAFPHRQRWQGLPRRA